MMTNYGGVGTTPPGDCCIVKKIGCFCFLCCVFFFAGMHTGISQVKVENLVFKDTPLGEALTRLSERTNSKFIFNYDDLNRYKVTVTLKDKTVEESLDVLLADKPFKYELKGDSYVISFRDKRVLNLYEQTGTVRDKNGDVLPGITVVLRTNKGEIPIGTTTDKNGKFRLMLPKAPGNVLIFSFIGMKKQEIALKDEKPLNVVMEEKVELIEEVVVNGMFTQSRNSYTGAVTTIRSEDILKMSQTNLVQALATLVPGMRIVENNEQGANPNHIPEIIIRGTSSLSASGQIGLNRPLIMLDGVEISLEQLYDMDMFEIDRVDVLKDASATAMYGDRAANGVIVVNRKKVTDSRLRVRYNFVPNVQFPDVSSFNLCNSAQKLELEKRYGLYKSVTGEYDEIYYERLKRVNAGVNTDWISKPLRNSWSFNHSLNMTGCGGGIDYSVNLRYGDTRGVMRGDFRQNYSLGFYFSYRYNDKLSVSFRSDWSKMDSKTSPYGSFSDFAVINPYDVPKDEYGEWNKLLSYDRRNPLYDATTNSFANEMSKRFSNSVSVRWDVFKGLYLNGTFSYDWTDSQNEKFDSPELSMFYKEFDPLRKGSYAISGSRGQNWNFNGTVNYNLSLNEEGSSLLTVNLGANISKNRTNNFSFVGIGFLRPALNDINFAARYPDGAPSGGEQINANLGLYGNMTLTVKNRYFVNGLYRITGNSNYGAKDLYAPYWSVGAGWNVHNENFLKDSWVNLFRIRGSLGYLGNGNFANIRPYNMYKYSIEYAYYGTMGAHVVSMGNDQLKAERVLDWNLGTDISLFNERLDISLNLYRQNTKDMMLSINLPPSVGMENTMDNLGEKVNQGYEVSVSAQIIRTNDVAWRVSVNNSRTWDKIKKISNALKRNNDVNRDSTGLVAPKIQLEEGESSEAIYAVRSLGIDPATGQEIFIKKDGTRTFEYDPRDKVALGSAIPKFEGSLSTYFTYKRVSLNMAMNFTFGGYIYNTTRAGKIENIDPRGNVDKRTFTLRWEQPGDIVDYARIDDVSRNTFIHSERFVEKKNEVYISSLGIMYDINPKWVKRVGLQKLLVGVTFSDVLRISSVKYERGTAYPYMRGFNFTISPTF
ncbi:SusC/RagA family TonB-linked outer membrane protein [Sanguibacteroides justesenii]|uniref:SusC/RagA family TonB-linked outer membrane protein n=1 Tax=Sanguibacteroides justesenii TaxID=1547597 RepID=UPI000D82E9E4|nr:SusC/RagA family TonB-linked outer membrane protein [Sanguibacteroides justesenii]PXZ45011.1 SusC/RagA family TonB-linked outer membrane protein [Sanguibacteroides justesenii]